MLLKSVKALFFFLFC